MNDYQKTIQDAIDHVAKGGKFLLKHRCTGKRMRHSHYFLNEDKTYKPCDLFTWANQLEKIEKHVAEHEVNDCRISTVWLGLDHQYTSDGPPLLFETMGFNLDGNDTYCRRYSTWQEAEEGHKEAIAWVIDGCKNND